MNKSIICKRIACVMLVMAVVISGIWIAPKETQAAAGKIVLNQKKITLYAGEMTGITVKSVKKLKNAKVSFKTDNKKVATVSKNGIVAAKKKGKATITVTSKANKKVKAKCKVTVKSKPKKIEFKLLESGVLVKKDTTYKLTVLKTTGLSSKKLVCTSENPLIATVTSEGIITGVSVGKTTVMVSPAVNKKIKWPVEVTVVEKDLLDDILPNPDEPQEPDTPQEPEVTDLAPGLYDVKTNALKKSWDELLADGTIIADGGYLKTQWDSETKTNASSDALDGKLIIDGQNYIGFENHAFAGCDKLVEVDIPVWDMGKWAFRDCDNLEKATISLNTYGTGIGTFEDCVNLKTVSMWESLYKIENNAFKNCASLENIVLPSGTKEIGGFAFSGCSSLENLTIPNEVEEVCACAFEGCSNLTYMTLPDSVTSLGAAAFRDCTKLEEVVLSKQLEQLSDNLFVRCTSLTGITIPKSVTEIQNTTFGESGLVSIVIPDSVTVMGQDVFYYCTELTEVTLPDGLTEIGDHAFDGCEKLTKINYDGTLEGYPWSAPAITN